MFDELTRKRCIEKHGIDPDESYKQLLLEIKVGGPVSDRLCRVLAGRPQGRDKVDVFQTAKPLTPRQREVLSLVAIGYEGHEIADMLVLSFETVKDHVTAAVRKLGARNRTHAVAILVARQDLAA